MLKATRELIPELAPWEPLRARVSWICRERIWSALLGAIVFECKTKAPVDDGRNTIIDLPRRAPRHSHSIPRIGPRGGLISRFRHADQSRAMTERFVGKWVHCHYAIRQLEGRGPCARNIRAGFLNNLSLDIIILCAQGSWHGCGKFISPGKGCTQPRVLLRFRFASFVCFSGSSHVLIRRPRWRSDLHDKGRKLDSERVFSADTLRTDIHLLRLAESNSVPAHTGGLARRNPCASIAGTGWNAGRGAG